MVMKKIKTYDNTQDKYTKQKSSRRSEGDRYIYFIVHTLASSLLFILIGTKFQFFSIQSGRIEDVFTLDFLLVVIIIIIVSFVVGMIGRIFAYYFVMGVYKKTATKTFVEINSIGINKIGARFFVDLILSSIFFSLGAVFIVQRKIFGTTDEIFYLIITYIIIRVVVYGLSSVIVWVKK